MLVFGRSTGERRKNYKKHPENNYHLKDGLNDIYKHKNKKKLHIILLQVQLGIFFPMPKCETDLHIRQHK